MLSVSKLLKLIDEKSKHIKIEKDKDFDFHEKDEAYLIIEGEILSYGDRNLTQMLVKHDPIGFSEAILARQKVLRYRRVSDIELLVISGTKLREEVNRSHIVVKSIIKYSLSRIFDASKSKSHILFEEGYIQQNLQYLKTIRYEDGDRIFGADQVPNYMYFIDRGSVELVNRKGKKLKSLSSGESFGESALLAGRLRSNAAFSIGTTILQAIDADALGKEIDKEPPLVQLALLSVLKRLELMNKLKAADE
jgi:CRP-like cAMP-binding protein